MLPRFAKIRAGGVLTSIALALCAHPASAASPGQAIAPAELATILSSEGAVVAPRDVHISAGIVARQPNPKLVVLSVEPATGLAGRYWVRFACRNAGDCLPFYASVTSSRPLSCGVRQRQAGHLVPASVAVIHPGDHATLVIRRERSVIQVAVVALESGAIGHSIRVETPDYKQIFHGQVVSSTLLEGAM